MSATTELCSLSFPVHILCTPVWGLDVKLGEGLDR